MFVHIRIEIFVKNLGIYLSQVQVKSITYRGNRQGHIKSSTSQHFQRNHPVFAFPVAGIGPVNPPLLLTLVAGAKRQATSLPPRSLTWTST